MESFLAFLFTHAYTHVNHDYYSEIDIYVYNLT
jgi:hypothetical protein